jgi:hypothetical protein
MKMKPLRKTVSLQYEIRIHDAVKKFAEKEEIPLSRIYEHAVEHCLSLPVKTWLRKPRKETA